jgi:serine protease Do
MIRSARWPLLVVCLVGGVAVGRWAGQPAAQGQLAPVAPAIPRELTSYRDVVKQVLPAVVSIESKLKARRQPEANSQPRRRPRPQIPDFPGLPDELRRFFEEQQDRRPDQMPQEQNLGFGSGFIIDPAGVILTNFHVVNGADEVEVTLNDGRKFTSSDFKSDESTDLAIVRLKASAPLPALHFGDSSKMEIGDRVLAVGAPFGLTGSVTHGIISATGRDIGLNRYDDFLQTDAAINPGNSGGPLVNLAGEVIGVNSAIKSRSGGFQGIGLAIASNMARNIVQQLQTRGTVQRGYLGVEMAQDVSPAVAERLGMKNGEGVVVTNVLENSPAAKAGFKSDDVIVAVNGQPVHDNRALVRAVGNLAIGKPAEVEVLRDGQPRKLSVTLEAMPKDYGRRTGPSRRLPREPEAVTVKDLGLHLADLTGDRAEGYGVRNGALIVRVDPDSLAADAGIGRGQVIVRVDRKDVASAEDAKEALEKGNLNKGILVHLRTLDGATQIVLLKTSAQK